MFEKKLMPEDIVEMAAKSKRSVLSVAIEANGYGASRQYWHSPKDFDDNDAGYTNVCIGNDVDVVGKLSRNIAKSIQFPASSAYLNFLGSVSAAMLGRFFVNYHGSEQPTSLYVVISQPPSTGKSSVNQYSTAPLVCENERINELRRKERKRKLAKLREIEREIKSEQNKTALAIMYEDKEKLENEIEKLGDIVFPVTDSTPEGLSRLNALQGSFAVISAEATAVNTLLGLTYSNANSTASCETVLKAWDMEYVSSARANGSNNLSFVANGCINVIAQDETVLSIMQVGERSNGVSERFLLLREKSMLGQRVFINDDGTPAYTPIDKELMSQYYRLIHNIMTEEKVVLSLDQEAIMAIYAARQQAEPHMADGGLYGHSMLRGMIGKMDKQVVRIASVLHVIRNWFSPDGREEKSKVISAETAEEALAIFGELIESYVAATTSSGSAGEEVELKKLSEITIELARQSKGYVSMSRVLEKARKVKPFRAQGGVSKKIKEQLLPQLESMNMVCVVDSNVYVNPELIR